VRALVAQSTFVVEKPVAERTPRCVASRSMNRMMWVLCVLAACGPDARDGGPPGGGDDDPAGPGVDAAPGVQCADGTELIYTIDQYGAQLSQFDPMTKQFRDLGALACPATGGATPFSMSVDRAGYAWVLYSSGQLFRVPIGDVAGCEYTAWTSPNNMKVFGMGFSSDEVDGATESLFIGGGPTQQESSFHIARMNPATFEVVAIGQQAALPEMTGTGSAELWGFFPDASTAHVVKFDKANAAWLVDYPLPSLASENAGYAFAHWGGHFWVFLQKEGEASSTVYEVDGATGQLVGSTPAPGRTIVGAGVSTCAPSVIL